MKFMMHLHGFSLKDEESILTDEPSQPKKPSGFMFQDPSMYENMTQEEREAETKRMMSMHKQWAGSKPVRLGVN